MCAEFLDRATEDSRLASYRPSERRAIIVHKYFLGIELGYDPGLACAVQSWEQRYACSWRRERQIQDAQQQLEQIAQHRDKLNGQNGQVVSWEAAARDWIANCAETWRLQHEQDLAE